MRKREPFSQGKCIPDSKTLLVELAYNVDIDCSNEYVDAYRTWITNTQENKVFGLENFTDAVFSQGTTESFDKFYVRHKDRCLRIFRGEYSYHQYMTDVLSLNDVGLTKNDCVIVSFPFADSGTEYQYHSLMQECTRKNIPVLVDCCWFGTCGEMTFDFTYPCIEDVVFSMSKTFPISRLRIGIRFSRGYTDGLHAYARDSYLNFNSMKVGIEYMNKFTSDYMFTKYRVKQLQLCKQLSVLPSPVVNLATGVGKQWDHLNRGGPYNRLCLSDELIQV